MITQLSLAKKAVGAMRGTNEMPPAEQPNLPPATPNRGFFSGHKVRTAILAGGTAISVIAGAEAALGNHQNSQKLTDQGAATITKLEKIPPQLCLAKVTADYKHVKSKYSESHTFTPDGWVSEATSGTKQFTLCVKTAPLHNNVVKPLSGPYRGMTVININANPTKTSDVTMTIYDKDATKNKNSYDDNWVHRAYSFAESTVNIFGNAVDTGHGIEADLINLNNVQANNLVSKKCGGVALKAMSNPLDKKHYLGDELANFYIHGIAGASQLKPTDVHVNFNITGTGLPDQDDFNGTLEAIEKSHHGWKFGVDKAPACGIVEAPHK